MKISHEDDAWLNTVFPLIKWVDTCFHILENIKNGKITINHGFHSGIMVSKCLRNKVSDKSP